MKILIKETHDIKELSIVDPCFECDFTQDLLGNANALVYDEADMATMSAEDFDWWEEYIRYHQSDIDEAATLIRRYGEDASSIIEDQLADATDYDEHHGAYQKAFELIAQECA